MALIYALLDRAGQWHGAHDLEINSPKRTTLTFSPTMGEAGFGSPFAGQALQVLVASLDGVEVGEICYTLDDRSKVYATSEIDELLFGEDIHEAWTTGVWPPEHADDAPVKPVPVPIRPVGPAPEPGYWQVSDSGRHYDLTITPDEGSTMSVEAVGADDHGRITTRLDGHLADRDHLALLGRLFLTAAADVPGDVRPMSRNGASWSEQELALVRQRHRDGADVDTIAVELGRSVNSIRYKLFALGLGPFPGPAATSGLPRPRQPAHVPAYTIEDLRVEHPNSHKRWEPDEDERLARRSQEGAMLAELVQEFGRNEGAITARLGRLAAQPPI